MGRYLLLIFVQLLLLTPYVLLDVVLEALLFLLDAASQALQLGLREVWNGGQTRLGAQHLRVTMRRSREARAREWRSGYCIQGADPWIQCRTRQQREAPEEHRRVSVESIFNECQLGCRVELDVEEIPCLVERRIRNARGRLVNGEVTGSPQGGWYGRGAAGGRPHVQRAQRGDNGRTQRRRRRQRLQMRRSGGGAARS